MGRGWGRQARHPTTTLLYIKNLIITPSTHPCIFALHNDHMISRHPRLSLFPFIYIPENVDKTNRLSVRPPPPCHNPLSTSSSESPQPRQYLSEFTPSTVSSHRSFVLVHLPSKWNMHESDRYYVHREHQSCGNFHEHHTTATATTWKPQNSPKY